LKVGGDSARVFQLRGIVQTKDDKDVELSITLDAVAHIEEALKQYEPELVVVDPFQSFLGAHIDMHRANEIRPVMDGLGKLAAKYGCAIVLIRHLKKTLPVVPTTGVSEALTSMPLRALFCSRERILYRQLF